MRINYFQHVPFEGLGSIESWVKERKYQLSSTRFYEGETPPELDAIDGLVIMGGPMGVSDTNEFPWLKAEREYIRAAIDSEKKVLGICLGAQLIADALGARVYKNDEKEIGWFPVSLTQDGKESAILSGVPDDFVCFHWHSDTFELPEGVLHLASSEACIHQAFSYREHVLALQFHPEFTQDSIRELSEHCGSTIKAGPFVQELDSFAEIPATQIESTNKIMNNILEKLFIS